ncbi:MAG: redoxin domain-containing protein [Flavobacteriales bacterium]|nr:redoxin domain-containing protein [Flavobacteriales bacterium]
MKNIFFLLTFFGAFTAQAQLRLVMDTKPVGSVIRVSKYLGDMEIPLDSMRYRGEAEVTFNYDSRYTDGVYAVGISTLETFQFVLVGQEPITAHIYESGRGMAFKADMSKENDAFNVMLNLADTYSMSMDTLSMTMNRLSDFDPKHDAITDLMTDHYHRTAEAYNHSLDLLNNLFPKSYTAEVLVPLDKIPLRSQKPEWQKEYDNDPAFNHVHYFDMIPFDDERIITNPFLSNKILEYLYSYTERSEQGVKDAIDKLLNMPNMNPKVQAFVIDLLIDFFTDKGAAEYVDHISRNYLGSCDLPLSQETLDKISQTVKFKEGDVVSSITLKNQTGHNVPLTALTGDLNVLVFWASWCPHCIREIPKLKALYDELPGKLGVYAVSLDTSKTDWVNTINQNNLRWLNVIDTDGWDSKYVKEFGVTSTPTLILLDRELRWIGRASSFDGLYELVKTQLTE